MVKKSLESKLRAAGLNPDSHLVWDKLDEYVKAGHSENEAVRLTAIFWDTWLNDNVRLGRPAYSKKNPKQSKDTNGRTTWVPDNAPHKWFYSKEKALAYEESSKVTSSDSGHMSLAELIDVSSDAKRVVSCLQAHPATSNLRIFVGKHGLMVDSSAKKADLNAALPSDVVPDKHKSGWAFKKLARMRASAKEPAPIAVTESQLALPRYVMDRIKKGRVDPDAPLLSWKRKNSNVRNVARYTAKVPGRLDSFTILVKKHEDGANVYLYLNAEEVGSWGDGSYYDAVIEAQKILDASKVRSK